ncbi:patatin-like phospholipase family protein [Allorhizobium terrae]|uniref:Patatin-like phospholipase family protein n=1 Tax=Allorhizobium terrae TaxID=1848972 RepID=A0A4S3ZV21_9HYPH|nr:patatin-like phospholipase family protein [Allorhizobium terrae]THF49649.1 patatin-like phospholipase family protein [Allorhizobium terrae]
MDKDFLGTPIDTETLLRQEAFEIEGEVISHDVEGVALNRRLNGLNRSALCISGGGIRSATFALGVLQALATHPKRSANQAANPEDALLGRFRYLSTVSGGGYIGSWLSAWLSRESFREVQQQLTQRPEGPDVEPPPIRDLRRDSNYLTPQVGLTSVDTWTAAAIVVRNLVLIWLLVISALATALLLLKIVLVSISWVGATGPLSDSPAARWTLLGAGALLLLLGQRYTLTNYSLGNGEGGNQTRFVKFDLVLAALGGVFLTTWAILPIGWDARAPSIPLVLAIGVGVFFTSFVLSFRTHLHQPHNPWLRLARWMVAGLVWGAVVYAGLMLLVNTLYAPARLLALVVFGPPWLLMAQITAETIYVAATSSETRSDAQREWLARAAGLFVAAGIGATATVVLGLLGSRLMDALLEDTTYLYQSLTGGGLAATAGIALLGSGSSGEGAERGVVVSSLARVRKLLQIVGGQVFLALLLIVLSGVLDYLLLGGSLLDLLLANAIKAPVTISDANTELDTLLFGQQVDPPVSEGALLLHLLCGFVLSAALAYVVSRSVNINRFSLHDLYRNRLVRAYLGATHRNRKPNPFTGFDLEDNPLINTIWPQAAERDAPRVSRLFHVVNCTLNVVSTRNKAWQQRKAMSFVITPRHAGAADLNPRNTWRGHSGRYTGAYRPSALYGGKRGISLGTAMAVSGAAANPNMGYNSSPSITLLFALFNIRLGWWLGNPGLQGNHTWRLSGPRQAILPWLQEAFGLTTSDRAYINLSDGGHFENLGLYEMVRRRVRLIVLSDAGCDPDFTFADLGNAVRKIQIDLGVSITFPHLDQLQPRIRPGEKPSTAPYCTIGHIHYADADGGGEDGYILYIKPSYHGTEEAGIRAYANEDERFPHDPTADQWFDESQFESYRSLGFEIVDELLSGIPKTVQGGDLEAILSALSQQLKATDTVVPMRAASNGATAAE